MAEDELSLLPGNDVPQPHSPVPRPAGQGPPIGSKGDTAHLIRVPSQASLLPSRCRVPESHRGIETAARYEGFLGSEGHGGYKGAVSPENGAVPHRGHVPEPDRMVIAGRSQSPAIGGEGHSPGLAWLVSRQGKAALHLTSI